MSPSAGWGGGDEGLVPQQGGGGEEEGVIALGTLV